MSFESQSINYPTVITLSDITELPQFEDIVANDIYQFKNIDQIHAWQGRVALRDLIRPPKFNGSIRNIELVAMEQPYERLLDARERGWQVRGQFVRNDMENATNVTRGYVFTADARSSGRGKIGQIQTELWYQQVPSQGRVLFTQKTGGSPVQRHMASPRLETEKFIELDDQARKIGLQVLRKNMTNPYSGGLPRS